MNQPDKRHRHTLIYRQGVEHWRAQGNLTREGGNLCALLFNYLAIAVRLSDESERPTDWLAGCGIAPVLTRALDLTETMHCRGDEQRPAGKPFASTYDLLVFAHMAWAINDWALGERAVQVARHPAITRRTSPFWLEYSRAVTALINGKSYRAKSLQTQGMETYWNDYLTLYAALAQNKPLDEPLMRVAAQFAKRNADKRLRRDARAIEGTGNDPVNWDFRQDTLLAYARRSAPLQFEGRP
ncbi:MAG: hypothetical protein AAFO81_07315 [Pseudomonadota bacterium]